MIDQLLATKLYIPPVRPSRVSRPRLLQRLDEGIGQGVRLMLISASAGFGKTSLLAEWVSQKAEGRRMKAESGESLHPFQVAWLSLDERDNDPARFLTYLVAALQTVAPKMGKGVLGALQSPQPPPIEAILTTLLNEIAAIPDHVTLVLDDYHVIDTKPVDVATSVDDALTFLIQHLPPQMHLVIATREDPHLPLAQLRVRGQLTELRATDLRFTPAEATDFLNQVMGLSLSTEDLAALETRTEGWIAGLQLAALSMQGHQDATSFIKSFTGSHHFVLDYLIEEVLQQQSESVQTFLLRTSILDRMCGPLCDAVLLAPSASGQETLEYIEQANLFIVPLDNERRWYRYHHLFGDLLRQRLGQSLAPEGIAELHIHASEWFESNGLTFEAFRHATAANDVERAERLIGSREIGLHSRSVTIPVLDWLASLPKATLDARPRLWVRSATLALMAGQTTGVEEKLQAAEAVFAAQTALQDAEPDDQTRDLIGQMACARATLALTRYEPEAMITQARRALEYLHPDNLTFRFRANYILSNAYLLQGDRAAAARACMEGMSISQKSGDIFSTILATSDMGQVQEMENQLHQAAETYHQVLPLFGDHPQPRAEEAHLGLARICYEWNDLDAAEQHGQQSLQLARQYDRVIDRFIISKVFLSRLKLARRDVAGAAAMLAETEQSVRQPHFAHRAPEVAAVRVLILLQQNKLEAAAQLAQAHSLPFSQARVHLAQGDPPAALAILEPFRQQMEAKGWQDERLKVMVLQAVAHHAHGEKDKAVQLLGEALALAEPGGFIRLFVDEGAPMAQLLFEAAAHGIMPDYVVKLLAAFQDVTKDEGRTTELASVIRPSSLIEPLSERELEVLRLLRTDLNGPEIARELIVSLSTLRTHTQNIYAKLGVNNRRAAVRRAEELDLF